MRSATATSRWSPRRGSVLAVARAVLASLLLVLACGLQAQDISEQQVKAAYLFKFGGYVEWPPQAFSDPGSPVVIGVAGDEGIARELARVVANRKINGRPVVVQAVGEEDLAPHAHVLFVGRSQLARIPELVAASANALVVTDAEKGLTRGGTINFVNADNRVRFEVSLDAAHRAGLRISAPLLAVAMRVEGGT